MTSDWFRQQANSLLDKGEPFAMFMLPYDGSLLIDDGRQADFAFGIVPWLGSYADMIGIASMSDMMPMDVERHTTTRDEYISGVSAVIESCRRRQGKTVYSRVVCGIDEKDAKIDWGKVAAELFQSHVNCFRYLYYTPQTGAWLGATPELLLDFCHLNGKLSTVSLAGTRRSDISGPWDEKNIQENRFVSDYIVERLSALGISVKAGPLEEVGYGNITHLCSGIVGKSTSECIPKILDAISPTPALCGRPKSDAIDDIVRYERHHRGCYGGYVTVSTRECFMAFVNLRCVHFDSAGYCAYGGGGITPQSVADAEYVETEDKTLPLVSLIEVSRCHKVR